VGFSKYSIPPNSSTVYLSYHGSARKEETGCIIKIIPKCVLLELALNSPLYCKI
jgi:hypothetical protein